MKYIEPKALKKGDTIEFIAPAGVIENKSAIERAKNYFEDLGYKVKYSKHLFGKSNYMSGQDFERLEDLHNAFADKDVSAIICARGGYGCLRLIKDIDYEIIKNNPKIFCGYSDITVLSAMFLKRANLITYSSPMAKGDFGAENISQYTVSNFFNAVEKMGKLSFKSEKIYNAGTVSGILFGGNLSSVVSLCGIDFIPDEKFIFFTEDINEPVYKIDKMLTQLFNIEKFRSNICGIITGDFLDNGYPEQLDELFRVFGSEYNLPVYGGFKITHEDDKITLPYGKNASIKDGVLTV